MTRELILPSGKTATIKKGRGIDLLNAQKNTNSSDEIPYALIAQLCEIDRQKVVYEDILELDLEDVIALQNEITGVLKVKKAEAKSIETQDASCPTAN